MGKCVHVDLAGIHVCAYPVCKELLPRGTLKVMFKGKEESRLTCK